MTDKRDLLLTLVFIKFLGDRFNQRCEKIAEEVKSRGIDDEAFIQIQLQKRNQYQQDGVFFLEDECLWDKLIEVKSTDMALAFDKCIAQLETIEVGKDINGNLIYKEGYPPQWDQEVFQQVLEQVQNYKNCE